jgi:hypothetical protein
MNGMGKYLKKDSRPPFFLVGVMHVTQEPWLSIARDGQLKSWGVQKYKNFEVVYFHSVHRGLYSKINRLIENLRWQRGSRVSYAISYTMMFLFYPWRSKVPNVRQSSSVESGIKQSSILVKIPEMTSTMRWKKIAILKNFLECSHADILIMTNSSSILNLAPIVDFVTQNQHDKEFLYAGPIHRGYDGDFVSGSFTILNRRSAEILFNNLNKIPLHVMDDIGFGTALNKLGIEPIEYKSVVINHPHDLDSLSDYEIRNSGHFRLKSGTLQNRKDVEYATILLGRMEKL